jgi:MFS family permease
MYFHILKILHFPVEQCNSVSGDAHKLNNVKMSSLKHFLCGTCINPSSTAYLKIRSSKHFDLTTICLGVFTNIFLYGILVPVLPFTLSTRTKIQQSNMQSWVSVLLAVYGGTLLIGNPLAGWCTDRSIPLLFGLLSLSGATLMLCLARCVALLVLGRVLQGMSCAICWTVGSALLVDTVRKNEVGQAAGYVS